MEPYDLDHHPVNAPIRSQDQRHGENDTEQVMPEFFPYRHPDNAYHKERYAGNQKATLEHAKIISNGIRKLSGPDKIFSVNEGIIESRYKAGTSVRPRPNDISSLSICQESK